MRTVIFLAGYFACIAVIAVAARHLPVANYVAVFAAFVAANILVNEA